jgi:hypothetical protein
MLHQRIKNCWKVIALRKHVKHYNRDGSYCPGYGTIG